MLGKTLNIGCIEQLPGEILDFKGWVFNWSKRSLEVGLFSEVEFTEPGKEVGTHRRLMGQDKIERTKTHQGSA